MTQGKLTFSDRLKIMKADLILYRANALTMNPIQPYAQMVAIKGERICGVGGDKDGEQFIGAGTKLVDCQSKTLIPGFIDAHCHILAYARSLLSPDLAAATSIGQIKALLRREAGKTPVGSWITATGYNEFYLAERRHPNRWDLDESSSLHPIRLIHRSGHIQVLNSLALKRVGITRETPEPEGGLMERGEDGEPNGLLSGMDEYVRQRLPPATVQEVERGLALADAAFLSYGITSLQDATPDNDFKQWQLFQGLKARGKLHSRLSLMIGHQAIAEFQKEGLVSGCGDSHLRLGAVKFILGLTTGQLYPSQEELNYLVQKAHGLGFQLAFHAVEETAIAAAASALELAGVTAHHRPRIEHASVCPPWLLSCLEQIGVVVVSQPAFIYYSGDRYLATVSAEELPWLYRMGSFYKAGLHPAASSDAPVTPPNPFPGLYAAVSRSSAGGRILLPGEALSPLAGLRLFTWNGAYVSLEERDKGSIETGKLADLALISGDPTRLPAPALKELRVEKTIIGGQVAFEAA